MSNTELQKVLIIDDNSDYRKLIKTFISKLLPSVEFIEYDPIFEGIPSDSFDWVSVDVLLLDYHLSIVGTTGLDILQKYHKKPEFPATIMLTAAGTEEVAISALKFGIYEYQPKQSLTKDKLKQSIIHAWEEKNAERKKRQEITAHNRSFSKEVFYENLAKASSHPETKRILIVIKPDNLSEFEQQIGVIGRDNLINYIGKNSLDVFKIGACNPNITRISDNAIAAQIDHPGTLETLEFNMQGLCKHLEKCSFKFSDEKYKFTVSIGVLDLSLFNIGTEQLINIAINASDRADKNDKNSFYLWNENDGIPEPKHDAKNDDKQIEPGNEILKTESELREIEETKKKLEAELKAVAEARAIAEAEKLSEQEAKAKAEADIKAVEEAKIKKQREIELKEKTDTEAAKEVKKKLEVELKAVAEAKEKLEVELKAIAAAKKMEREGRGTHETAPPQEIKKINVEEKQLSPKEEDNNSSQIDDKNNNLIDEETEELIKKLLNEKKIIQIYQPVIAMSETEDEIYQEVYNTGLQTITNDEYINSALNNTSAFTLSLQQFINEWVLRQIFLRITESGTANCKYRFLIMVTEAWFSDVTLFNWLQKILSQTKKYSPGKSIILQIPLDIFLKHEKRAQALITTLVKTHFFTVALSDIESIENLSEICRATFSRLLLLDIEQLEQLNATLSPENSSSESNKDEAEDEIKTSLLNYLKSNKIQIITTGIENATLLTDSISLGTNYVIGDFVGAFQDSLVDSGAVESFELT